MTIWLTLCLKTMTMFLQFDCVYVLSIEYESYDSDFNFVDMYSVILTAVFSNGVTLSVWQ